MSELDFATLCQTPSGLTAEERGKWVWEQIGKGRSPLPLIITAIRDAELEAADRTAYPRLRASRRVPESAAI